MKNGRNTRTDITPMNGRNTRTERADITPMNGKNTRTDITPMNGTNTRIDITPMNGKHTRIDITLAVIEVNTKKIEITPVIDKIETIQLIDILNKPLKKETQNLTNTKIVITSQQVQRNLNIVIENPGHLEV
uniref:Uncharacterized protein n=1 Tax=Cacopsylla melanoneura TaxID=428564 RepID=A0A8D9FCU9_9HEMI